MDRRSTLHERHTAKNGVKEGRLSVFNKIASKGAGDHPGSKWVQYDGKLFMFRKPGSNKK